MSEVFSVAQSLRIKLSKDNAYLLLCLFNKTQDFLQVCFVDKCSHPCILQQGVTNFDVLSLFHNFFGEGLQGCSLYKHPSTIAANLRHRDRLKKGPFSEWTDSSPLITTIESRISVTEILFFWGSCQRRFQIVITGHFATGHNCQALEIRSYDASSCDATFYNGQKCFMGSKAPIQSLSCLQTVIK